MEIKVVFIVLHGYILTLTWASKLALYSKDGKEPLIITGSQCESGALLNNYREFSCACVTGLWAFYESNCDQVHLLAAGSDGQCFPMDFLLGKVNLLSPPLWKPSSSSAVVFDKYIMSMGGRFDASSGSNRTAHYVPPGNPVVITTGNQAWRLPTKKVCMKPTESSKPQFCMFNHGTVEEYRMDDVGCTDVDENIPPLTCVPYMQDENTDIKFPRSCDMDANKRVRRDTRSMGRVFLGAVEGLKGNDSNGTDMPKVNITSVDENHGLNVTITHPILNSEIWNYMTLRAQVRLGIREPRRVTMDSPAFNFLDLAKRILQRACPDHYVRDEHFEIAVGAFISVQKNHMKFVDQFADFATTRRIEDALTACMDNTTDPYPFPQTTGNITCNGTESIVLGAFQMFNKTIELSISEEMSSRNSEPIVETVWKIFTHAHSACFPFFKKSFNDHHRFATIMLPLFTNGINLIWRNTTLTPDIYSGFLGNAVELMDSVDYCSMFSRLESKYPWELPRPKMFNARRKRETDQDFSYQCLENLDSRNICPSDMGAGMDIDDDIEVENFSDMSWSL